MDIVVCIKQVPETTEVRIDPQTNTLIREGVPSIVNPFDMYAIEEGLRLKERYGGKVAVLTMGPLQAVEALREALAMGADEAVLLSDRVLAGSDTLATSYALSMAVRKIGFDMVICGKQAIDGDTAQVGPEMAEHLGVPFVAWVRKIEDVADGRIRVQRLMDDGYEVLEMPLPALITVVKEINEPRLPSLRGKMRARRAQIPVWKVEDIGAEPSKVGLEGSPTKVFRVFTPKRRREGEVLRGEPGEAAEKLLEKLEAMGVI
ncbi:MAG TPA: electron transfer flavoprotein subunit beta/FixA family protein [Candidatus Latescibacteria bacterium]|nr:electron transfer flavoprotein subunit beta/FixA family protein [Candidatus Latescibacterota bacterium]